MYATKDVIITLLALRTTNDLSNARKQNIHRSDCFIVVILAHVKCFDLLWIVVKNDGLLKMFLHKESFVLRLKINTPLLDEVLKFFLFVRRRLHKDIDRFRIAYSFKIIFCNKF